MTAWLIRNMTMTVLAGVSGACLAGCGGEPPPPECPAENEVWGVCAGLPLQDVCDSDTCTEGVECAQVVQADSDDSLQSAASSASSGTCIALAPGTYKAVSVPG